MLENISPIITSLNLELYILSIDICWWASGKDGDFGTKQAIWGRAETAWWDGFPLSWEVLMKGLAAGKYLDGKGGQHSRRQGNLQQARESGWHWRFKLGFKLNFSIGSKSFVYQIYNFNKLNINLKKLIKFLCHSILELTQILQPRIAEKFGNFQMYRKGN